MNTKHIMRAIEYARNGMFVPPELTRKLISSTSATADSSIIVMFSYEMLPVLSNMGYKNVTLVFDKPRTSIYNIAKHYGYRVKTFEELKDMKFDVVIGNPPYQELTQLAGQRQGDFWFKFLKKAIEAEPKYITFVTPKSIFSSGRFGTDSHKTTNILRSGYGFTHIWTDTSAHFNVGIQTIAFTLKKGYKGKTLLVDKNEEITIDDKTPVPFYLNKINNDIVRKTYNKDDKWDFRESIRTNKDEYVVSISSGRYRTYDKLYVGSQKNNSHTGPRGEVNNCRGMIIPRSKVSIYKSIFSSKLFKYIFQVMGGEDAQSPTGILQSMPYVEPDRIYTDKKLYKMFNLSQKEIEKIRSGDVE